MSYTEQQMIDIGGALWNKGGRRRVYLNDWPDLVGMRIEYYNTGHVSNATLNGELISNSHAQRLLLVSVYWQSGRLYARNGRLCDNKVALEMVTAALALHFAEPPPTPIEALLAERKQLLSRIDEIDTRLDGVTTREAAQALGVTVQTVIRWAARGQVRARKERGRWLILI